MLKRGLQEESTLLSSEFKNYAEFLDQYSIRRYGLLRPPRDGHRAGGAGNRIERNKMVRNLKILGLALVAAMAMSAVVASAASAQTLGKITSDGAVTLTGSETPGGLNKFTAFGSTVECTDHYTGHKTNTTNTLLASGETSVTIRPHYTNCTSPVTMNGCDYAFYDFTTAGAAGTYSMKVDVVCPAGQSIFIDGPLFCDTTVPAQTGLAGAHATNQGGGHVLLKGAFTGVSANNVCLGSTKEAVLHTDVTIKGLNAAGGNTAISISD